MQASVKINGAKTQVCLDQGSFKSTISKKSNRSAKSSKKGKQLTAKTVDKVMEEKKVDPSPPVKAPATKAEESSSAESESLFSSESDGISEKKVSSSSSSSSSVERI
mmetsp:Transcript_22934/g.35338  ORF Transcript_22934/g.35338 Transcript_22934/m.35338 type:complete len:107 (+) Transcript_22934:55-375(+)